MNSTYTTLTRLGFLSLVAAFFFQCSNQGSADKHEGTSAVKKGAKVEQGCFQDGPNCLPPLDYIDEDGIVWTPDTLAGKVVIVNFWATWCKPCQHEVPDLARVYRKYKDQGVVILGLMTDKVDDVKLAAFQKKYGLDYPVVRVGPEISEAFGHPRNLPTNFVYSRGGHLVFDSPGAMTAGALETEIKQLL